MKRKIIDKLEKDEKVIGKLVDFDEDKEYISLQSEDEETEIRLKKFKGCNESVSDLEDEILEIVNEGGKIVVYQHDEFPQEKESDKK